MPTLKRLLLVAVVAALLAAPSAAVADPACVRVGVSVLGTGTDVGPCTATPYPVVEVTSEPGDPSLVEVRVRVTVPIPLLVPEDDEG